jgi:hypothetical protein
MSCSDHFQPNLALLLETYQQHQEVSNHSNIPDVLCSFPNTGICVGIDLSPNVQQATV